MSEGPPPVNYPPILFGASLIFGLIYAGTIIFAISAILFVLALKEVTEGYTQYWSKILHYSLETVIISGLSTFVYTVVLFGLCNAFYALGALGMSLLLSTILAIVVAGKFDNKVKESIVKV